MSKTKLYTMILRDRKTGREEILYGHTTENVIQEFGCPNLDEPRFGEGDWELVIRPWTGHRCDWSRCPGHKEEYNYCSMTRRIEFDENGEPKCQKNSTNSKSE